MPHRYFNEPMPDCVPEHYRSLQEDADRQYELRMQRQERYQDNLRELDAAVASGLPVLDYGGYDACRDCRSANHDTMTDGDDDLDRVICRDPACPRHRKGESR